MLKCLNNKNYHIMLHFSSIIINTDAGLEFQRCLRHDLPNFTIRRDLESGGWFVEFDMQTFSDFLSLVLGIYSEWTRDKRGQWCFIPRDIIVRSDNRVQVVRFVLEMDSCRGIRYCLISDELVV